MNIKKIGYLIIHSMLVVVTIRLITKQIWEWSRIRLEVKDTSVKSSN